MAGAIPGTNPTPSRASDSCISVLLGGNDVPFLFHERPFLDSYAERAYNHPFVVAAFG